MMGLHIGLTVILLMVIELLFLLLIVVLEIVLGINGPSEDTLLFLRWVGRGPLLLHGHGTIWIDWWPSQSMIGRLCENKVLPRVFHLCRSIFFTFD
jgi:hypothetical protein